MKKLGSSIILLLACLQISIGQSKKSIQIYFDHDSDVLDDRAGEQITSLLDDMEDGLYYEYSIIGHTDQDGSGLYNQILSERRAKSVKLFMEDQGTASEYINIDWKGESQLVNTNNTQGAKSKNRRVEIVAAAYDLSNAEDILKASHQVSEQSYQITTSEKQTIIADQGTVFTIPANAFGFADGSNEPIGEITLNIKEAFSNADFVSENLFTKSKDQLLETGGMIKISASANGKELKLKENHSIEITYPQQQVKRDMELFYGESGANNDLDWVPTNRRITPQDKDLFYEDIDIDLQEIVYYDFGEMVKPVLSEPELPSRPRKEWKPQPPAKPKAGFPEDYIKYETKYKNYEKSLEDYYDNIPLIQEKINQWEQEVSRRITLVNNYKYNIQQFLGKVQAKIALKKIEKMEGVMTSSAISSFLQKAISANVNYKYNDKVLYRKVLGQYTTQILTERNIDYRKEGVSELNVSNVISSQLRSLINEYSTKLIEHSFEETGKMEEAVFSQYVTKINKLGWINCDRFLNYPEQHLASVIINNTDDEAKYYLIFSDIRSLINANNKNGKSDFGKLPIGEKVKLVAVKLENNQPLLASKDVVIKRDNDINLNFAPSSLKQIKNALNAVSTESEAE